ncbi:TraB domain-containing protein [Natrialbaceae archaeon A-gly3]
MSEDGKIHFVPSVHFSPVHRRRVREAIDERDPDLVAVELDERRFRRLVDDARTTPEDLFRERPPATAATYSLLRAIQRTVIRLYGLDPERTDMETAIETAAERDLEVALIDEPITEIVTALSERIGPETIPKTMLRAQLLGPEDRLNQVRMLTMPFQNVESGDDVEPAIRTMRRLLPEVTDVLIDRRDRAMARRLARISRAGYDVVAVIGAGHHNGIRRELQTLEGHDLSDVEVPIREPARSVTTIPIE